MATDDSFEEMFSDFDIGEFDREVAACFDVSADFVGPWMDLAEEVMGLWHVWRAVNPGPYDTMSKDVSFKALVTISSICTAEAFDLIGLSEAEDKSCPLPLIERAFRNKQLAEQVALLPVFGGAIDALNDEMDGMDIPSLADGLLASWVEYEDAFLRVMRAAVADLPMLVGISTPTINCDTCSESADCLFNEDNATDVNVLRCLLREVVEDGQGNPDEYVLEYEAQGGEVRVVHWHHNVCSGSLIREVVETFENVQDLHTWMIGMLVT